MSNLERLTTAGKRRRYDEKGLGGQSLHVIFKSSPPSRERRNSVVTGGTASRHEQASEKHKTCMMVMVSAGASRALGDDVPCGVQRSVSVGACFIAVSGTMSMAWIANDVHAAATTPHSEHLHALAHVVAAYRQRAQLRPACRRGTRPRLEMSLTPSLQTRDGPTRAPPGATSGCAV
ncbi:uncharacterized protein CC84DRAFT_1007807 [Paraphaeosphaeria sporulosa]|uniref:Uncharacterized protein n=1 Tax=Paraphaeosphaeria sporulosa TaxID=1460663 RepID=A0A177C3D5_9PLEO|nr:uncharacterized protein CC84DRAFT_1007807 [Paraphaeosphaeria sporulosa]OAG02254.1 hypothetical protein CC84DRAFT_1007807 [Paraphaeosphaeria sporulosa]